MRHHKKEKAFGPGPNNNYTTGSSNRRFWQRKPAANGTTRDAELGAVAVGTGAAAEKHHHNHDSLPTHTQAADVRPSYATDTTAVGEQTNGYTNTNTNTKYGHQHSGKVTDNDHYVENGRVEELPTIHNATHASHVHAAPYNASANY